MCRPDVRSAFQRHPPSHSARSRKHRPLIFSAIRPSSRRNKRTNERPKRNNPDNSTLKIRNSKLSDGTDLDSPAQGWTHAKKGYHERPPGARYRLRVLEDEIARGASRSRRVPQGAVLSGHGLHRTASTQTGHHGQGEKRVKVHGDFKDFISLLNAAWNKSSSVLVSEVTKRRHR